jgi:capsular exopolysaccharide synthesis family protein
MEGQERKSSVSWVARSQAVARRYFLFLRRFWWIVALTAAVGVLGAGLHVIRQPLVYVSAARMMVSGKISLQEGATYSEELGSFFGTQIELMQSEEVRRRAAVRLKALRPELEQQGVFVSASLLQKTAIFILQATGPTLEYTQRYLDACLDEYIATKKEMRSEKSETTQTAITDELARIERDIRAGEDELLDFQRKNNIGFLQEEGNSAGVYLAKLNRQVADLKTELQLLQMLDLDQNIERNRKAAGESQAEGSAITPFAGTGPEYEYLRAKQQIEMLRAQREDFGAVLRPKHPTMIELNEQIVQQEKLVETFRKNSVEQLKTRRESVELQAKNLESVIKEWETKALTLSERLADYNRLKSKLDRAKAAHERLLGSLHSVDFTRNIDQDVVSILQRASPPVAMRPGIAKNLILGLLAGLCAGLAVLFVLEQSDDRITTALEMEPHFRERILAHVPEEALTGGTLQPLRHDDQRHAFAEALRALRSSIFFMEFKGEPPKAFLVTSAVPGEGKSTIATNLAITMAFSGARVLLVDADLRRGQLHAQFGLRNGRGLSEALRGEISHDEACIETSVPNLSLFPRGAVAPHPGELFLGKNADKLLGELYAAYDYVVFDSCPVMAADDTTSLAPKIDATLFVLRFRVSSARTSRKALALLSERQANVLGIVCNSASDAAQEYSYYSYPDYYGPVAAPEKTAGGDPRS